MRSFFTHGLHHFAILLAGSSFALGTLIFLLYLATMAQVLEVFGIALFVGGFLVHLITLVVLLVLMFIHIRDFHKHSTVSLLLLLNMAIGILYINLSIQL